MFMLSEPAGYVADAWGESIAPGGSGTQPAEDDHLRFHGGFVEDFLSTGDGDVFYRMVVRRLASPLPWPIRVQCDYPRLAVIDCRAKG